MLKQKDWANYLGQRLLQILTIHQFYYSFSIIIFHLKLFNYIISCYPELSELLVLIIELSTAMFLTIIAVKSLSWY